MLTRLISYNVNGLRSAINKGFVAWLTHADPEIICLQEIKASPEQVDTSLFDRLGYYHYWFPAEKKGYSGVALFTKIKPAAIIFGMNHALYDTEGRVIRSDFGEVTHLAVYFPSGTTGAIRQSFKMQFLSDFMIFVKNLLKTRPNIIISGDLNIAHKPEDINFPEKHHKMSGFLPEERNWMDEFLTEGFVDTFRIFNQEPRQYSWWTFRAGARSRNLGWRIDYNLISLSMLNRVRAAQIHADVCHSDHCPVSVDFDL